MTLNEKEKHIIKHYLELIENMSQDKDFNRYVLRVIDNTPRELKLKMVYALLNSGEIELC